MRSGVAPAKLKGGLRTRSKSFDCLELGSRLGVHAGHVRQVPGLKPNDDPAPMAEMVEDEQRSIMIVSHLPMLNRLASLILVGDPDRLQFQFSEVTKILLAVVLAHYLATRGSSISSATTIIGAGLIAASLAIMIGLLGHTEAMRAVMPLGAWYVLSALLAPVGYVIQDVVADAMTVEAVPRIDREGLPLPGGQIRLMHTTMQTLGRVAIVGGGIFVALLNVFMFEGVENLDEQDKVGIYIDIYLIALLIPVISVLGVTLGGWLKVRDTRRLVRKGFAWEKAWEMVSGRIERPAPNWWILGGSLVFVVFTITMGLSDVPFNQEIIFYI